MFVARGVQLLSLLACPRPACIHCERNRPIHIPPSRFLQPFAEFAGLFFVETFNVSDAAANLLVVWVKLAVLLTLLPAALLLDMRLLGFHTALIAGAAATSSAWLLFASGARVPPAIPAVLAGMGFATSVAAALPLLSLRLRPSVRGRMFGLFLAILHVCMIVNALCIGALRDTSAAQLAVAGSKSRSTSSIIFLATGQLVGLALAIALAAVDGCREPTPLPVEDANVGKKA